MRRLALALALALAFGGQVEGPEAAPTSSEPEADDARRLPDDWAPG